MLRKLDPAALQHVQADVGLLARARVRAGPEEFAGGDGEWHVRTIEGRIVYESRDQVRLFWC
ncbi:hypothetical protein [Nocardioides hungaricus]